MKLTKFLEKDIIKHFMGSKLHPGVDYGKHVVGVLVPQVTGLGIGLSSKIWETEIFQNAKYILDSGLIDL